MAPEIFSTEAIVLNSLDFKDHNKILTLFTPHFGLIKLIVKLSKRSSLKVAPLISPLTKGQFYISKGRSDLFSFHEGSILDQRLGLRKQLARLTTAGKLVDALCQTQWPEVPSTPLYLLFDSFLQQINETADPLNLVEIFFLKLLKHEGVLQTNGVCASCNQALQESYRFKGESYCRKDAPHLSLLFSLQEELHLQQLARLRDFKMLLQYTPTESFRKKINSLFEQSFDQDIRKH